MVYIALPPTSIIIQCTPMKILKIIYDYLAEFF